MQSLSQSVVYYGSETPLPRQHPLRAGPLSLLYEAGDLRYIRLGYHEIVRRVYVAVRDQNWNTIPATLSNIQIEVADRSFEIRYDARHLDGLIDLFWRGTITGAEDGTITFSMDGVAGSTFPRNRIGFCVLHPIRECAGRSCSVEQTDGAVVDGVFPEAIAPHQPFRDMRAITYAVTAGIRAELRFSGDTFEMEDQRNWTDASFKTYSTPLALAFPVEVAAGTKIAQSVSLRLHDDRGELDVASLDHVQKPLTFSLMEAAAHSVPPIGLGIATHGQPLSPLEIERLKALRLHHLRVDLHLSDHEYPNILRRATKEAQALNVALEIALFLSDPADVELAHLLEILAELQPPACAWLIFHVTEKSTTERWVRLARQYLSRYDADAAVGGGTNAYFAELNRERPPISALDFVTYSINPQVHAFDNASLAETLAAQAETVASARRFGGALPLTISPVTLKPQFNPNATAATAEPSADVLPPSVDVRQMSLFGAGWTVGSLKYLAESGAATLTYYETTGWRGVMSTTEASPRSDLFPALPGTVFPLYHVLADVGEFAGGEILPSISSEPLRVEGLALSLNNRLRIIVANLSEHRQRVTLHPLPPHVVGKQLRWETVEAATHTPESFRTEPGERLEAPDGTLTIDLPPYAVARLDATRERAQT